MPSSAALRVQIEASLAHRVPAALTPATKSIRDLIATGIPDIDELLDGGLPVGALTELIGPECSGRTSLAHCFLAQVTLSSKVCAWIDVSNTFHPESAAAVGVDLKRLLWVRCGVPPATQPTASPRASFTLPEKYFVPPATKKGLHGGGHGAHPRTEVKGLSDGVGDFLRYPHRTAPPSVTIARPSTSLRQTPPVHLPSTTHPKPWSRLEQALLVADLLLQAGGFGAIVLDMGGIAPDHALRVPLATWFRYRAAAERARTSVLLLTQHACSKSSAALVLRLEPGSPAPNDTTVLGTLNRRIDVSRQRFTEAPSNVIPLRKPPQRATSTPWQSPMTWAGTR